MPKPRKINRPIKKNLTFAESDCARIDLHLYSEVEGRVPHGAWTKFLTELVEEYFRKLEKGGK